LEPGTPAVKLDGHLPEPVKTERRDALMALQQPIAFEHAESLIGYELDVLVDEQAEEGECTGRTFADAPEIDGCVRIPAADLLVGEFVSVEITGREGYDLVGTVQ